MTDDPTVAPRGDWELDESYGEGFDEGLGEMTQYILRHEDGKPTVGLAYHTDGNGQGAVFLSLRDPLSEELEQVHLVKGSEHKITKKATRWMEIIELTDSPAQFSPRLYFLKPVLLYEAIRLLVVFARKD